MLPLTPISTGNPAWTAGQFNDHEVEFENMVTSTNQTLSASNTNQLAKAAFIYGTGATTFQENGPTANNCNLTAFTGINGLNVPDAYSEMHGAEFSFNHSIASTGPVTVNVGQSPSQYLGTKNLYLIGGGALPTGVISGYTTIRWNNSSNYFELIYSQDQAASYSRGATLVVAASNASGPMQNSADYLCTGSNDSTQIAVAIAAVAVTGGTVQLSEGTFNLTNNISTKIRKIEYFIFFTP